MPEGDLAAPTVRPATLDDAAAIAALADDLGYPTPPDRMRGRLAPLLDRPGQRVLVAERNGSVVGWLHLATVEMVESDPFAEIYGLIVAADERGRGTGVLLLAAAEAWAASAGFTRLRVRSNVIRERAHRFYRREGYVPTKDQRIFDKDLGTEISGG
ncbi:MAG TPA: GNAT family N-acetyltransferase [Thermoanaerobaculia bacterium]|nr:GNAT family N-acetyltransferase [Thermoanaerobaculia bacterium]